MRVLIVASRPFDPRAAQARIKDHDLQIATTFFGAMKAINERHFDVVLMDPMMSNGCQIQKTGPEKYGVSKERVSYALPLALLAFSKGINKVAILTNMECLPVGPQKVMGDWPRITWQLFDRISGRKVGTIDYAIGYMVFFVDNCGVMVSKHDLATIIPPEQVINHNEDDLVEVLDWAEVGHGLFNL